MDGDGVGSGVVGVVLAAGEGRRFGGPKALVRLDGERLVDRAVATVRAGGCPRVLVVEGAAPLGHLDAEVVPNPLWRTGMGSSLRAALTLLGGRPAVTAAVVLLVDTPWVGPEAVRRLVAAHAAGAVAAQAVYAGAPGHPVLLGRSTWAEVAGAATGDLGARAWLRQHRQAVAEVDCDGTGDPRDVDRPDDLLRGSSGAAGRAASSTGPAGPPAPAAGRTAP